MSFSAVVKVFWFKAIFTFLGCAGLVFTPEVYTTSSPVPMIPQLFGTLGLRLPQNTPDILEFGRIVGVLGWVVAIFALVGAVSPTKSMVTAFILAQLGFVVAVVTLKLVGTPAPDLTLLFCGTDSLFALAMILTFPRDEVKKKNA